MQISFSSDPTLEAGSGAIVIGLAEGAKGLPEPAAGLDRALGGEIRQALSEGVFEGKEGQSEILRAAGRVKAAKVILIGLGQGVFDPPKARRFAATAMASLRRARSKTGLLVLPKLAGRGLDEIGQALVEGSLLGEYRFLKYKSEARQEHLRDSLESVDLRAADRVQANRLEKGLKRGLAYARGTVFARDLVNEPASVATPAYLADRAAEIARSHHSRISCQIHDRTKLEEMGAGGLLAVSQGSSQPPFMVHLTYRPAKKTDRRVVLVGKGLTFDAGGLSLKPSASMEDMKIDMSGAAAVLGAFSVLAELAPSVEVHGVVGLCENMPSGTAIRPGDIVTTMSGRTVEILNTDAEGRVVLADCLHYGAGLKPRWMVDLATLTGACMVALGQEYAGIMTDDQRLADRLQGAADQAGELVWRLPLAPEYAESMKGKYSDLKNISGSKYGGAITAGLFLKEFVGQASWAHIDIAGPAWAEKDSLPYQPIGGTGYGVRTMLRFIEKA